MTLVLRTKKTKDKIVAVTVKRERENCKFFGIPLNPKESERIEKRHQSHKRVKGQVIPEHDFKQIIIEKAEKTFTGWQGIIDNDGNNIPFDKDLIEELYLLNASIVTDAVNQFTAIGTGVVKPDYAEDIEGN